MSGSTQLLQWGENPDIREDTVRQACDTPYDALSLPDLNQEQSRDRR